jgi:hypothetical protein
VAARLPALGDDDIDAGRDGPSSLVRRPDRVEVQRLAGMDAVARRVRIAPERRENRYPLLQAGVEQTVDREGEHEVDPECAVRQFADTAHAPYCLVDGQPT